MVGSTVVPLRHHHSSVAACELPPPKRCHSWNGLADLASPSSSRTPGGGTPAISTKLRKTMSSLRPRSLNLSMSHLAVPEAVLELNAKVDSEINKHAVRGGFRAGSADNILDIVEESEGGLSTSTSGASLSVTDLNNASAMCGKDVTPLLGAPSQDTPDSSLTPHSATFTLSSSSTNTPVDLRDSDVASPHVKPRKSMTLTLSPSFGFDDTSFEPLKMPAPPDKQNIDTRSKIQTDSSISKPTHSDIKSYPPSVSKELSSSNPSLADSKRNLPSTMKNIATIGQLSLSQPLLRHFCSSLEQLRHIGSANTAPSDLNRFIILGGGGPSDLSQPLSPHRRSHSLGNIVSPTSDEDDSLISPSVCMKCGRADRLKLCHGGGGARNICDHTTPKPLHGGSVEMIQVT